MERRVLYRCHLLTFQAEPKLLSRQASCGEAHQRRLERQPEETRHEEAGEERNPELLETINQLERENLLLVYQVELLQDILEGAEEKLAETQHRHTQLRKALEAEKLTNAALQQKISWLQLSLVGREDKPNPPGNPDTDIQRKRHSQGSPSPESRQVKEGDSGNERPSTEDKVKSEGKSQVPQCLHSVKSQEIPGFRVSPERQDSREGKERGREGYRSDSGGNAQKDSVAERDGGENREGGARERIEEEKVVMEENRELERHQTERVAEVMTPAPGHPPPEGRRAAPDDNGAIMERSCDEETKCVNSEGQSGGEGRGDEERWEGGNVSEKSDEWRREGLGQDGVNEERPGIDPLGISIEVTHTEDRRPERNEKPWVWEEREDGRIKVMWDERIEDGENVGPRGKEIGVWLEKREEISGGNGPVVVSGAGDGIDGEDVEKRIEAEDREGEQEVRPAQAASNPVQELEEKGAVGGDERQEPAEGEATFRFEEQCNEPESEGGLGSNRETERMSQECKGGTEEGENGRREEGKTVQHESGSENGGEEVDGGDGITKGEGIEQTALLESQGQKIVTDEVVGRKETETKANGGSVERSDSVRGKRVFEAFEQLLRKIVSREERVTASEGEGGLGQEEGEHVPVAEPQAEEITRNEDCSVGSADTRSIVVEKKPLVEMVSADGGLAWSGLEQTGVHTGEELSEARETAMDDESDKDIYKVEGSTEDDSESAQVADVDGQHRGLDLHRGEPNPNTDPTELPEEGVQLRDNVRNRKSLKRDSSQRETCHIS
ncbi:uncharacterized protein LOC103189574 [Callorhinchus milii]|uniref:uncharacterized protein LOC103189574 n=1 Tax=Callorhinchus milii TaxID=7868 RepID=UPI00045727AD|nr:uncharacterized protein LOC103189574 [Callorhinchus milii]|eukprot:gi/632982567/ref/XP_007908206.1/ PREDICTED: spore wall protein 2-like [Callorhinchus milii]